MTRSGSSRSALARCDQHGTSIAPVLRMSLLPAPHLTSPHSRWGACFRGRALSTVVPAAVQSAIPEALGKALGTRRFALAFNKLTGFMVRGEAAAKSVTVKSVTASITLRMLLSTVVAFAAIARADAQMPLLPVVQGAFGSPGVVAGLNVGGDGDQGDVGAALAWTPASGRLQATAGAGVLVGTGHAAFAYGTRVAVPIVIGGAGGRLGAAPFVGIGGSSMLNDTSVLNVPVGVALGWRTTIGESRSVEVSVSPFYVLEHTSADTTPSRNTGEFRAALGVSLALASRVGLTLGGEIGTRRHGLLGAGISYQLRSH
jgi:hypothetical protein